MAEKKRGLKPAWAVLKKPLEFDDEAVNRLSAPQSGREKPHDPCSMIDGAGWGRFFNKLSKKLFSKLTL